MGDINTPVAAGTKLGTNDGPGGALRSYVTLVSADGTVIGKLPVSFADVAGSDVFGIVGASPAEGTVLGRLKTIGTRRYGTPLARVAIGQAVAQSAAMPSGTAEVLLHASVRCFVRTDGEDATNAAIPLEAGEKFHVRVPAGGTVSVIRDTTDGFLNVVPVLA